MTDDTPADPPAPVMYRVRVAGKVSAHDLQTQFEDREDLRVDGEQHRTVLVGRFADSVALTHVLDQLREQGVDIRDVRRLPGWYELTVADSIDDADGATAAVANLLGGHDVEIAEFYTLLRIEADAALEVDDVATVVESNGHKVGSIRALEGPAEIPTPRQADSSEARTTTATGVPS